MANYLKISALALLLLAACQGQFSQLSPSTTRLALRSIQVTPDHGSVAFGATQQLTATGTYEDGSTADITSQVQWSGGGQSITVDSAGVLSSLPIAIETFNFVATLGSISSANVPFGTRGTAYLSNVVGSDAFGSANPAIRAVLEQPYGLARDSDGGIYIADTGKHRLRFMPVTDGTYFGRAMLGGYLYTIAGTSMMASFGDYSGDGGPAVNAGLYEPSGLVLDSQNNVIFFDSFNGRLRMIPRQNGTYYGVAMTANYIYTIAGDGNAGPAGDGGPALSASLDAYSPFGGIAIDANDNLFIAGYLDSTVRMIPKSSGTYYGLAMTANYIYTIAGTTPGYSGNGGPALSAKFDNPTGIAVDSQGNLFIADRGNHVVRLIANATGTIYGSARTANYIYTIAGTGTQGFYAGQGGVATATNIGADSVAIDPDDNVLIGDTGNSVVLMVPRAGATYFGRAMTANRVYTVAGRGASSALTHGVIATSSYMNGPVALLVDENENLYVTGGSSEVSVVPNTTTTLYGQSMTAGFLYGIVASDPQSGNGGPAAQARLSYPGGVAVDSADNLYIADGSNYLLRMVPARDGTYFGQAMTAGNIYKIAGTGNYALGTGGTAALATDLGGLFAVSVGPNGSLFIVDTYQVHMLPAVSGTYFGQAMTAGNIYRIAGTGTYGYNGDNQIGTNAQLRAKRASVDTNGNLYIGDWTSYRVRFVPNVTGTYFGGSKTAGFIYTIAGTGTQGYNGEGLAATATQFGEVYDVRLDSLGNIYIVDSTGGRIRVLATVSGTYFGVAMTAGKVYTVAGDGSGSWGGDGNLATAAQVQGPHGLTFDASGNLFITDNFNAVVRMIPVSDGTYFGQAMLANHIYPIAGRGNYSSGFGVPAGTYAPATGVRFNGSNYPSYGSIATDSRGDLYFTDYGNCVISKVYR